ncbi:S-adenosyl-L-methionine-dependent methyltransferase [Xylona heveae TC161]|uniref:peptide chain release factor N(5)-glutamine methyltransferase n=1 Tax=Xylona heveae (strain CBS 132557 / TC161) TaxID=1328760 RepID=A0A165FV67_XYLHT|nr:S-adenosyl-L-methionine-dependent methyltransferase [Xylona heveae TC161]KZF21417.1 S-adenosyl-L-methionine-dependent methyltransferase [Xylona heveae TC161]
MPRLSPRLLLHARKLDPLLCLLIRPCRDIASARNELRWLKEHAIATVRSDGIERTAVGWRTLLSRYCEERARGKPLQYILGNQPFGEVEILCRPGVLIPRHETEACVMHLANNVLEKENADREIKILDLCTGTGCIPLLMHSMLSKKFLQLKIFGVDISAKAIRLSNDNLEWNIRQGYLDPVAREQIRFIEADVFAESFYERLKAEAESATNSWDFIISNPPYISPKGFDRDTSASVRNYEPRLALVPERSIRRSTEQGNEDDLVGDLFYPRLYEIADKVHARGVLFEVGDLDQASRAARVACESPAWTRVEIWKDFPDLDLDIIDQSTPMLNVAGTQIVLRGQGNGRAVYCRR